MRAIILAAGRGKRMGDLTDHHPKALLSLHGKPFIEWQMRAIQQAGITQIAIVKGYKAEVFSYPIHYFVNHAWENTNMLSTLLCAEQWLNEDSCVVSYSDIVYHAEAIHAIVASPGDIVIAFDPNWLQLWQRRFEDPLSDAEIFQYKDNILMDVGGKAKELQEIQGQYMGLLKFTTTGWQKVKKTLQPLTQDVIAKMDMTTLLKRMLKNNEKIFVTPINTPWCEIDNADDYQLCREIFVSS